ncbi:MAG: PAS domain-containing protein [Geminicoccaceae bacterium]|nr:MAG: PAS domain-containing protein [Geminicoccaceae bacterium]
MADVRRHWNGQIGEVPPAGAIRHPSRLLRELALWAAPVWATSVVGLLLGWWSPLAALGAAAIGTCFALPFAVVRRRVIENLVDLVESWPESFDREPPPPNNGIVDRGLVDALWRFFRWLRARAEREAATTALQARLLRVLPDPLFQIDGRGYIVTANRAAQERFGVELVGRPLRHVLRDPAILDAITLALDADLDSRLEVQEPKALGRRFQVEVLPVRIPDEAPLALLVLRERTSEHMTQRLMSDFVANVSHEIRTPLTAVRGFIETLQGPAKDDAKARERFLATMAAEADRMNRLVSELLVLSRVELMERERPEAVIDLVDVLHRAVASLQSQADAQGIALRLDLPGSPLKLRGDADQLLQVFLNLLDNALKYGGEGRPIDLACRRLEQAPPRAGRLAGFEAIGVDVVDRGDGIPQAAIPRLTERFFRVDTSRSRRLGGTGLGLAIVKHIVNRHQGHLAIDSTQGEGSRFTVYLPADLP